MSTLHCSRCRALHTARSEPSTTARHQTIQMGIRKYLATGFTAFDPTNPDRKLMDSPCQAAAESVPASSQTTWFRSVNASVQYSTMHLEQQEVLPLFLCRLGCRGKCSFFVRSQNHILPWSYSYSRSCLTRTYDTHGWLQLINVNVFPF